MDHLYRVSFFKRLIDSNGRPVDACQGAVEVRAPGKDHAVNLARHRFAEVKDVADWSLRADYEELELVPSRKRGPKRARRNTGKGIPSEH